MKKTDEYGLKTLQNAMLSMLNDLCVFCKDNQIEFCLAYGSALGAVRHHGFIPWDDDVDIYMTQSDYDRFCDLFSTFAGKKYYLQRMLSVHKMCQVPKIRMNNTYYGDEMNKGMDMHKGIYIDIFVLYNAPEAISGRLLLYATNMYILLKNISNNPNYRKNAIINGFLAFLRRFPKAFLLEKAYKRLTSYSGRQSKCYLDTDQCKFSRSFIERNIVFPVKYVRFEDKMMPIPADADRYLTICYGDYMIIPDEESIMRGRHACCWDVTQEREYTSERNGKFLDETLL